MGGIQPAQASQAAAAIEDPDVRNQALHGIVGGWAEADPAALVQFVMQLPSDAERGSLLSQSLERWVKHDPEAASQWINSHETGPDTDQGAAAVATMDSLKPDLAISWAVSVVNPKLRSETLVTVLRNWVTVDLPAANGISKRPRTCCRKPTRNHRGHRDAQGSVGVTMKRPTAGTVRRVLVRRLRHAVLRHAVALQSRGEP